MERIKAVMHDARLFVLDNMSRETMQNMQDDQPSWADFTLALTTKSYKNPGYGVDYFGSIMSQLIELRDVPAYGQLHITASKYKMNSTINFGMRITADKENLDRKTPIHQSSFTFPYFSEDDTPQIFLPYCDGDIGDFASSLELLKTGTPIEP